VIAIPPPKMAMIPHIHQGTPWETRGFRFVFAAGSLDIGLCLRMTESKNGTNPESMAFLRVSDTAADER
jgi:hypothetical protein